MKTPRGTEMDKRIHDLDPNSHFILIFLTVVGFTFFFVILYIWRCFLTSSNTDMQEECVIFLHGMIYLGFFTICTLLAKKYL